jgi:hypothetical protein
MTAQEFDRSQEDVGNIVQLEHVNVWVPDQRLATLFYVTGLGLTRDPYLMTGIDNMWVNVGRSQFHLMTGPAQVLRGCTGTSFRIAHGCSSAWPRSAGSSRARVSLSRSIRISSR